jgi:hypothetical protein
LHDRAACTSRFDYRQISANVHGCSLACRKALRNRRRRLIFVPVSQTRQVD